MKKIILISFLLILVLALSGCGLFTGSSETKAPDRQEVQNYDGSGSPAPGEAQNAEKSPEASAANPGVVAKSNNAISSREKEAILKELDKDLDSLLNNINSMEDVEDSDLQ